MHEKPGQKACSARSAGLRRRVIFELDPGQLPLLEAVRERHGSTRRGLIAALEAAGEAQELLERAEAAEERLAKAERAAKRGKQGTGAEAKRQEAALAKAAKRERALAAELESARQGHSEAQEEARREEADYQEALEELREEVSELQERAVDWLFCARCGQWIPPEGWAWRPIEGGGRYAHHRDCGDHRPGAITASSWLAQRG